MVQVGMCQKHGIEAIGREREPEAVVHHLVRASLEEPAVDEDARLCGLHEEL